MPKQRFYDLRADNPLLADVDDSRSLDAGFMISEEKSSLGQFFGFESDQEEEKAQIESAKSHQSEELKEGERAFLSKSGRKSHQSSSNSSKGKAYAQWLQDLRPELRHIKRTQDRKFNSFTADIVPLESQSAANPNHAIGLGSEIEDPDNL